jgi:ABC-type amino acid transport substrate-binding protein
MTTEKKWLNPERLDVALAVLIALVSLTTALAAWRTSVVGSSAADANRQGIIDAIKKGTGQNESWRKVYEEGGYATGFSIESAAADAMDASGDKTYHATAKNLRQYLLPSLQLLSEPLGTQEKYVKLDGTFDLEKRFADLEAESPDIQSLNPAASFDLADKYSSEQRWLTIGTVLLAISLFWLGMAEILADRARTVNLLIGLGVYLFGVVFLLIIEAVALLGRGGVL